MATSAPDPGDPSDVATSFQQNPAHDGHAVSAPAPPLVEAWRRPLGALTSYPLIAQGRVFVATQNGILYVFDLRNGATLWSRSAGVRIVNLAYDEGRIIAMDDEGFVAAYSATTGATVWASSLTKYVTPVAAGGRVFGAWGIALDGATGARLNLQSPMRNDGDVTPALDGTRAYYASGCGGAAAIRRSDLGLAWTAPNNGCATGPYQGPSAVYGGRLYNPDPAYDDNGQPGYVHDAATGAIVGRYPDNAQPAFADGIGLFNAAGTLQAQDLSTGATLWSFPGRITQAPLIAQGRVYVADGEQPAIHVLDLHTGQPLGRTDYQGAQARPSMASAGGLLIVPADLELIAFRSAQAAPQPGSEERVPAPVTLGPPAPADAGTANLHTDASRTNALNLAAPAPPLKRIWRLDTGTQPRFGGGRLFLIDGQTVVARDPHTAAPLWTHPVTDATSIAYDRGRLFVAQSTGIEALDAATGTRQWLDGRAAAFDATTADGELYVRANGQTVRYDEATGARVWTGPSANAMHPAAMTLDATRVFRTGQCRPLSRATGEELPEIPGCLYDSDWVVSPVSAGHLLGAFDAPSGRDQDLTRGEIVAAVASGMPPAVLGNVAVTVAGGVSAWEFPNWTPRWRWTGQHAGTDTLTSSLLIVGRTVYFTTNGGYVRGLDLETGRLVWTDYPIDYFRPYSETHASPAVGDGVLVVPGKWGDGLIAYESA